MTPIEATGARGAGTSADRIRWLLLQDSRAGWEYVDPGDPIPSPLLERPPREPVVPVAAIPPGAEQSRAPSLWQWVAIGLAIIVALAAARDIPALLVLPVVVAFVAVGPWLAGRVKRTEVERSWHAQKARLDEDYARVVERWRADIQEHDARERRRVSEVPLWYPIRLGGTADRIDVVGGVLEGWQHMLILLGVNFLREGRQILVLDLTESDDRVWTPLAEVVSGQFPSRSVRIPAANGELDLLTGMPITRLADMLADTLNSMRDGPDDAARATDAHVITTVLRHLAREITTQRLVAALTVLEGGREEQGLLTDGEMTALTREIDAIGTSDRVQERIRLLRVAVEMLDDVDDLRGRDASNAYENRPTSLIELWSSSALSIVTTSGSSRRRKELRDTLLFHAALDAIREHPSTSNRALFVLGGDRVQDWAVEDMARQAERRGVRLALFFQHMHDHVARLVGSSASSTVFMRLGNGREASAAAEQIGRGHRFVLSQLTRQTGMTTTIGGGSSVARTESTAMTRQTGTTSTGLLTSSASEGSSFTQSVGATASQMSNWSTALNASDSRAEQRVYEFVVEPVALQQLPPTAFFLVEGAQGQERAVLGDCHVSIALQQRVASQSIWG